MPAQERLEHKRVSLGKPSLTSTCSPRYRAGRRSEEHNKARAMGPLRPRCGALGCCRRPFAACNERSSCGCAASSVVPGSDIGNESRDERCLLLPTCASDDEMREARAAVPPPLSCFVHQLATNRETSGARSADSCRRTTWDRAAAAGPAGPHPRWGTAAFTSPVARRRAAERACHRPSATELREAWDVRTGGSSSGLLQL